MTDKLAKVSRPFRPDKGIVKQALEYLSQQEKTRILSAVADRMRALRNLATERERVECDLNERQSRLEWELREIEAGRAWWHLDMGRLVFDREKETP